MGAVLWVLALVLTLIRRLLDIRIPSHRAWQIFSVVGLNQFFAARGYTFFLVFLYTFVILLLSESCLVGTPIVGVMSVELREAEANRHSRTCGWRAAVCAISVWVAISFRNNKFEFVWPILFLKYFADIFFQILDVASLSLFLITLDCQVWGAVRHGGRGPFRVG